LQVSIVQASAPIDPKFAAYKLLSPTKRQRTSSNTIIHFNLSTNGICGLLVSKTDVKKMLTPILFMESVDGIDFQTPIRAIVEKAIPRYEPVVKI
jgi:hypothetical protein